MNDPFRDLLASNNKSITFIWHLCSQVIYKILVSIRVKILITKYLNPILIPLCTRHFPMETIVFSNHWCQQCDFYHLDERCVNINTFQLFSQVNTLLTFIVHFFERQSHYGVYVPRDNYNKYCYHNNNSPYYHFLNTPNFANAYTVKDVQKITSKAMLSIYKTIIFFSTFYIFFYYF